MQSLNTRSASLVLFLFGFLLVGLCHAAEADSAKEPVTLQVVADLEHQAVDLSPDKIYIYGGRSHSTLRPFNQLISIDIASKDIAVLWTPQDGKVSPAHRNDATLRAQQDKFLVLYDGTNDTCVFNDYWQFDLTSSLWQVIVPAPPDCEDASNSSPDSSSSSSNTASSSDSSSSTSDSSSTASSSSSNTASSSDSPVSSTSDSSSTASSSSGKSGDSSSSSGKSGDSSSSSSSSSSASNSSSSEAKDSSSKSEDGEGMTGPKIWRTGPSPAMWAVFSLGIVALSVLVAFYVWREWRRNSRSSYSVVNRF